MVLRAPEPEFDPRYARSGGQQPGMAPGKADSGEGGEAGYTPEPGYSDSPGVPGEAGYTPEPGYSDSPGVPGEGMLGEAGYTPDPGYSDSPGVPGEGPPTQADLDRRAEEERRQAFLDEDSGTNIKDLIYDLSGISKDSEAQKEALAGQKSEYLEAVDRMVREGALRRMGSGGAFARGFGTIAGKYATAINATALKNKEIEMNGLSTAISNYVNLHSAELDDETKKMLADWQIHTDKIAQFHAEINNWLTDTEADSMSNKGYTQLYTLFNELVLSGEVNPTTGQPWTNADIMNTFYTKRHGKVWWNGVGPDGSFDPDAVKAQLKGIDSDVDRKEILQAMRADLKTKNTDGQYDEALAGLSELIGDAKDDAGSIGGAWSEIKSWF